MSINNKDIQVKGYFRESLYSRMEAARFETGKSRSQFLQDAVMASLHRGSKHSPVPARRTSPKVGPLRPGAPFPIRC